MFGIFRSSSDIHFIDQGRVACPVRCREVELDVCAACNWIREINQAGEVPFVRCRAEVVRCWPALLPS